MALPTWTQKLTRHSSFVENRSTGNHSCNAKTTQMCGKPATQRRTKMCIMFVWETNKSSQARKTHNMVQEQEGILSADKLHPGQHVFVDHFMCSTQGGKFKG